MKRMIAKILLFTLMLCIGVLPFLPAYAQAEALATILFTNDTCGFTDDLTYIERYKENTQNAFLLACGNFSKGSAQASFSNAKYSGQLMKEAGYDLLSLGTSDFSYGFRAMKRFSDYAGCPIVSGNVNYSSAAVFEKSTVQKIGGTTVGFFSVVDSYCADYIPTARAEGYRFEDEISFAKEQVAALKNKCDKVVCIASFAENNSAFTPEILAEAVEGIDILICSNLHREVDTTLGSTRILAAPEQLAGLGEISLLQDGSVQARILPRDNINADGTISDDVSGTYKMYGESLVFNREQKKILADFEKNITDPIAKNKTTVYGVHEKTDISLLEETPMGDLFADAMTLAGDKLKAGDTALKDHYVVACVNGTAIKNNIASGDITLRDVFNTAEIAEDVYFYEADAALLYTLMEKSVAKVKYNAKTDTVFNPSVLFLQISGFNIVVDPTREEGEKIIKMYVLEGENEVLIENDDTKKFLLAVNESFAKGFAGYEDFIALKPVYVGDFLVNYIRTCIASAVTDEYYVSPGTESRITFKRIEELQPNGDAWAIIDKDYETHAACEVLVDGIDNIDCSQVDENGEVRITLKTGAHGVSVNGEDIYTSTESGLGLKKGSIIPIVDYKLYYKTLDEAYKIDEDAYKAEAVKGYFDYLSRAFVETKLTEEGEVVKATQDIFNVWDDFLENPDSFIKNEEEDEDDEEESVPYPNLDDFAYTGNFESNVFVNTPKTTYSLKKSSTAEAKMQNVSTRTASTGDVLYAICLTCFVCFASAGGSIAIYLWKKRVRK